MPFKLSEETVDALLDKLGTDDAFRTQFKHSPRAALASLGHKAAASAKDSDEGIWACCVVKELASKETIRASRDALRTQLLSSQASHTPITLEVAKPST
jgi:putative modified peptide